MDHEKAASLEAGGGINSWCGGLSLKISSGCCAVVCQDGGVSSPEPLVNLIPYMVTVKISTTSVIMFPPVIIVIIDRPVDHV